MKAPRVARRAMLVEKVVAPPLDNNAYLILDETSKQAAVVDPALGGQQLLAKADELGAKVVLILNTHGHVDATADDGSIRTATGAKIAIFAPVAVRIDPSSAVASTWPCVFRIKTTLAPSSSAFARSCWPPKAGSTTAACLLVSSRIR